MISVVLATHNEEKNLARCLDSIKSFADEIIIADGESTDRTVEIAKSFGAKIISTTNKPNFHVNKQMAMDKARGELVLQLDADEVVDQELADFILKTHRDQKAQQKLNVVAWNIKRKNFFINRFLTKGGQYPDPVIRLYINGKAKLPQKDVHEQMIVDGNVDYAQGHLLHYSYPDFSTYLSKFNTYTDFRARQLFESKHKNSGLMVIKHLILLPIQTFLSLYIRHKGFFGWVCRTCFCSF